MLTDLTFAETDFTDADMLVLPGGMPGTKYLNEYQPLRDLLADFYKKGGKVAAICAAPTVFPLFSAINHRFGNFIRLFFSQKLSDQAKCETDNRGFC